MDMWFPKLHVALRTAMSLLLCASSREVTVRDSDLKLCEEHNLSCVTNLKDCGPRPPLSEQQTLNMSCYYLLTEGAVTCEWREDFSSHTQSDVSLIFSGEYEILSCLALFNPAAILNVTARIQNYMTGREIWSQPHTVDLCRAIKPSPPAVAIVKCTEASVSVSWRCSVDCGGDCVCRLRYRVHSTHIWTQAPDSVSARPGQTMTFTIRDLQPFTIYRAAVSCTEKSGIWSEWSSNVTATTLDRVPSRPPEVFYRVEKRGSDAYFLLHLMWKDLDLQAAGGRIVGYQVSKEPMKKKQLQDKFIQNVTEAAAQLVVEAGYCSVSVKAFNMAGFGPAARLQIDTHNQSTLPSITNLWASGAQKGLLIQWKPPRDPPPTVPLVSYFVVHWRSETLSSIGHWTTVDNYTSSTIIEDLDPIEPYLISVFPVYNQQCGSAQSLPASLQQGALMEAVKLKVMSVTKTTVRVVWAWQRKSEPIRVDSYSVVLRRGSEGQTLSLWPDQWQHTFINLKPSTEYSLLLLAENVSVDIKTVKTDFDENVLVAAVTPLLLLAVTLFIISILSRTVYKSYFFPLISSPRGSTTGQWLMDPKNKKPSERSVLNIEDFQVTDILGQKRIVTVATLEEELHEDACLLSIRHPIIKLDADYICDPPVFKEPVLVCPSSSYHPVYIANSHHADPGHKVYPSEKSHAEDAAPVEDSCLSQKEEERRLGCESPHEKEMVVKSLFSEFMANRTNPCVYQMSCETGYVVNASSFQGKSDVETESRQTNAPSLTCENDYIANSSFPA